MLNRHSKKFISYLRSTSPDFENRVYTYSYLERNHPEPIESIYATARYLSSEGYLEIAKLNGSHFGVILTEKALHPYEFSWTQIISFLFTSIFTPIVVSIATTLLTLWLSTL